MKINRSNWNEEIVTRLGLKSAVIQEPFEAESAIVIAARIHSPPTTKGATTSSHPLLPLVQLETRATV